LIGGGDPPTPGDTQGYAHSSPPGLATQPILLSANGLSIPAEAWRASTTITAGETRGREIAYPPYNPDGVEQNQDRNRPPTEKHPVINNYRRTCGRALLCDLDPTTMRHSTPPGLTA